MITNLENKLKFIELMDQMKDIERAIRLKNGRKETDAEHTFHLAIMIMVFIEDFPELDYLRTLKIALLHDIVEIFAGDTLIFDEEMTKTKDFRERKAINMLEEVLGKKEFEEFRELLEEYMDRSSREAIFVHHIDKLQPIMQNVLVGGKGWHEFKFDKYDLIEKKYKKMDDTFGLIEVVKRYFDIAEKGDMFYIRDR